MHISGKTAQNVVTISQYIVSATTIVAGAISMALGKQAMAQNKKDLEMVIDKRIDAKMSNK